MRDFSVGLVVVIAASLSIIFFIGGFAAGYLYTQPMIQELSSTIDDLRDEVQYARQEFLSLSNEKARLDALLSETMRQLEEAMRDIVERETELERVESELRSENEELKKQLEESRSTLAKLEEGAARLERAVPLLIQLRARGDVPADKEGATNYWLDIKNLISEFEPSLTPSVDRIINNIDGWIQYVKWLERAPPANASASDILRWLLEFPPSANNYFNAVSKLVEEVENSIISKIMALREE